jgi:hypothetical protein
MRAGSAGMPGMPVVGGAHADSPSLALVHPIRGTYAWHTPYS